MKRFCTHPCECTDGCSAGCCLRKAVDHGNPIVVAYQAARARDVVRTCGESRNGITCELEDRHDWDSVGWRIHQRGAIAWRETPRGL